MNFRPRAFFVMLQIKMFGIHTPATTLSVHVALVSLRQVTFADEPFCFLSASPSSIAHLDEIHSASIDTPESRFTSCFEYQKALFKK